PLVGLKHAAELSRQRRFGRSFHVELQIASHSHALGICSNGDKTLTIDFRLCKEEIDIAKHCFQQKTKSLIPRKRAVGDARVHNRSLATTAFRHVKQIGPELRFCQHQHCRQDRCQKGLDCKGKVQRNVKDPFWSELLSREVL